MMQSVTPKFGLLSLHTGSTSAGAHLYNSLEQGVIRLNNEIIVDHSDELVTLEKQINTNANAASVIQHVQEPLISLVNSLPISEADKRRLTGLIANPSKSDCTGYANTAQVSFSSTSL